MTQEFESRRQRRLAEAQAQAIGTNQEVNPAARGAFGFSSFDAKQLPPAQLEPAATPEPVAPEVAQPMSRRELREQLRQGATQSLEGSAGNSLVGIEPGIVPMFETSSGFSLDTTTNSIVLPVTPDALTGSMLIETGVTLKTGSIPLPNLNTTTGSIPLPEAAQIADDAQRLDSSTSFVSNISPVAAQDLIRQNPELGFASVKPKGVQGQLFYALTVSIMMLTVGGLLVVAWMYGFIK